MFQNFPLFRSHLDLAHQYWEQLLQDGDWAIDATCGNGHDTLYLAKILKHSGGVIGIDIQEEAILRTKTLLQTHLSGESLSKVHLFHQSHIDFPQQAYTKPIRLIVYNLGYLPKGNKDLTTQTESTLASLQKALDLIMLGGIISITCYPGHAEGAQEEKSLLEMLQRLPPHQWNVCHHTFLNRQHSPSLLLIQKSKSSSS
jgi:SAM-dependent methyltransferase